MHPSRSKLALALALAGVLSLGSSSPAAGSSCWPPPVRGRVVDPFRPPACPWCPGNRGIEYAVATDVPVTAVAAGTVTFAGTVAGVRYVVVAVGDGRRVTYGRLADITVAVDADVRAGQLVGRASGDFFFGLRDGDHYVDPAPHLGELVARPRLVPVDGTPRRPAPPGTLRCGPGRAH